MHRPNSLELLLAEFRPDPHAPNRPPSRRRSCWRPLAGARHGTADAGRAAPAGRTGPHAADPPDKATLAQMTDQAFRTATPHRAVEHLIHILDVQGVPRFFGPLDRTLMKGFQSFGGYAPAWPCRWSRSTCTRRRPTSSCPARRELLRTPARAHAEGVRMNVNFLGEAILERGGSRAAPAAIPAGPAMAGDRGRLDQDLHALLADFAAGPRAHRRHAVRPAGAL